MSNSPNEVMDNGPTQDHFDLAFDLAIKNSVLLQVFFDYTDNEPFTPLMLYHQFGGLPKMDKTEHDDRERDEWSSYMENVLDAYRGWLENKGHLLTLANRIRDEQDMVAAEAAAEYAAECAIDHQEVQHLNGGW